MSALFDALNVVHGETEERSLLQFYATTFAVSPGAVVCGLIAIIGVLPMAFRFSGLGERVQNSEAIFRWTATLLLVMIWLNVVYRIGPSRSDAKWRWMTWRGRLAAILLVVASMVPKEALCRPIGKTAYVLRNTYRQGSRAAWAPEPSVVVNPRRDRCHRRGAVPGGS